MVFVLLILVLQDFPDTPSDVEVGCSGETSQEDLIGSEITLAEVDKKLEQDELGQFLITNIVVV